MNIRAIIELDDLNCGYVKIDRSIPTPWRGMGRNAREEAIKQLAFEVAAQAWAAVEAPR